MANDGSKTSSDDRTGFRTKGDEIKRDVRRYAPITQIWLYEGMDAVKVRRECRYPISDLRSNGGKKDIVKEFSRRSRNQMIEKMQLCSVEWKSMITLTYPQEYPMSGRESKVHLNRLLQVLRRRNKNTYFWFLEFQLRGAAHYHIFVDFHPTDDEIWTLRRAWTSDFSQAKYCPLTKDFKPRYDDITMVTSCYLEAQKSTEYGFWEPIRTSDGAKKYVYIYGAKEKQKRVPKSFRDVGRFWGTSRNLPMHKLREKVDITEEELNNVIFKEDDALRKAFLYPRWIFGVSDKFDNVFRSNANYRIINVVEH